MTHCANFPEMPILPVFELELAQNRCQPLTDRSGEFLIGDESPGGRIPFGRNRKERGPGRGIHAVSTFGADDTPTIKGWGLEGWDEKRDLATPPRATG